jgi:FAD synthetase
VLEWRYTEVWAFLRYLGVEYCVLYERGYTSLGGTNDTHPNPRLKVEGVEGVYRPAWMLEQEGEERAGRES